MEFLKSLVPAVISGEGSVELFGALPKETGPRLISIKRLGLMVMGQTIDEDPVDHLATIDPRLNSSRPAPQKGRTNCNTPFIALLTCCCFFLLLPQHII